MDRYEPEYMRPDNDNCTFSPLFTIFTGVENRYDTTIGIIKYVRH